MAEALLDDDAWSNLESIGQVDGVQDSPLTLPGKRVEVEGVEMEPEERSMKGWSQVWRKISQEEKDAAADTRGWEAFKSSYPYLAHDWRRGEWREQVETKSVEQLREMEWGRWRDSFVVEEDGMPNKRKVEKWLREGGERGE